MNRDEARLHFLDALEGSLPQDLATQFFQALSHHPELAKEYRDYQKVVETEAILRKLELTAEASFTQAVMNEVKSSSLKRQAPGILSAPFLLRRGLLPAAMGAIACVVLLLANRTEYREGLNFSKPEAALKTTNEEASSGDLAAPTSTSYPLATKREQGAEGLMDSPGPYGRDEHKSVARVMDGAAIGSGGALDSTAQAAKPLQQPEPAPIKQRRDKQTLSPPQPRTQAETSASLGVLSRLSEDDKAFSSAPWDEAREGSTNKGYEIQAEGGAPPAPEEFKTDSLASFPESRKAKESFSFRGVEKGIRQELDLEQPTPYSHFSLSVGTDSYLNLVRSVEKGVLPPPSSVKVEEYINYFSYDYPKDFGKPVSISYEIAPSPFNQKLLLLKIGVRLNEPNSTTIFETKGSFQINKDYIQRYQLIGDVSSSTPLTPAKSLVVAGPNSKTNKEVTLLYELERTGSGNQTRDQISPDLKTEHRDTQTEQLAMFKVSYIKIGISEPQVEQLSIPKNSIRRKISEASDDFRFAAAVSAFGHLLMSSPTQEGYSFDQIVNLAQSGIGRDESSKRKEFIKLVKRVSVLKTKSNSADKLH